VEFVSNVYLVDRHKVVQCNIRDITERKQAEEALRESEALFRQAIEAAGAVPYSHNYEMDTYTFMGEGILALTGYPVEEMTPALYGSLEKQAHMIGESSHLHPAEAGKLMRAGQLKKWRCDSLVLARDGTPRWIADASVAIFDGTGKTIGSIGILQDITDRKQAEEALRRSQEIRPGHAVSSVPVSQRVAC
jgi:PAS domain S-box-containing protein